MGFRTTARHIIFAILGFCGFSLFLLIFSLFLVIWFATASPVLGVLIFSGGVFAAYEATKKILCKYSPKKTDEFSSGEILGSLILLFSIFLLFFDSLVNGFLISLTILDLFAIPLIVAGIKMYKFFHNTNQ